MHHLTVKSKIPFSFGKLAFVEILEKSLFIATAAVFGESDYQFWALSLKNFACLTLILLGPSTSLARVRCTCCTPIVNLALQRERNLL